MIYLIHINLLTNRIIDMDFPPLVREELEDSKDKNISVKKENISKTRSAHVEVD